MKLKTVPSRWLQREGRRLDCGPYTSGALESKLRLEDLSVRKDPLQCLTEGYDGGIYNGPKFSRNYVASPNHGVPFVGSKAMLMADLSNLPLLRKKDALSKRLSYLRLSPGTTLISCSGTIGRMVYVRPDMDGIWSSQHIMKVVPAPHRIPSGYLYAYLSSKFGVPIVTSSTYGAIIQHIEPHHLADLPVPRLGNELEQRVHELVEEAGQLRVNSSMLLKDAVDETCRLWGASGDNFLSIGKHPDIQVVNSGRIERESRFDAFFYGQAAVHSDAVLDRIASSIEVVPLGSKVREVFETTRFGRITVEDPRYGVPFLSISDLVQIDPNSTTLISKSQAQDVRAQVDAGWIILPRVGQLHGVFGTACYIPRHLDGIAVSDNNIRIVPPDLDAGGYLWAALTTDICYQQIIRRACGTSIPYLDSKRVASIPIPWPSEIDRKQIATMVQDAMEMRSVASETERKAIDLVEQAIEEVA